MLSNNYSINDCPVNLRKETYQSNFKFRLPFYSEGKLYSKQIIIQHLLHSYRNHPFSGRNVRVGTDERAYIHGVAAERK